MKNSNTGKAGSFDGAAHHIQAGFFKEHAMHDFVDWCSIDLFVDEELFSLCSGTVSGYRHTLDLKRGVTVCELTWVSPAGKKVVINTTRVASMKRRHCAAIRYEVSAPDSGVTLRFESKVSPIVDSQDVGAGHTELLAAHLGDSSLSLQVQTTSLSCGQRGLFTVGTQVVQCISGSAMVSDAPFTVAGGCVFVKETDVRLDRGESVAIDKFAAFYTSVEAPADELFSLACADAEQALADGFDKLVSEQVSFWKKYWKIADVEIDGNVMMDLNELKDNIGGGIYSACLGGPWMAVVKGFAGMREYPNGVHFDPVLPAEWTGYRFSIPYRGSRIGVNVGVGGAQFTLLSGPAITFDAAGKKVTLSPAKPIAKCAVRKQENVAVKIRNEKKAPSKKPAAVAKGKGKPVIKSKRKAAGKKK